jgi:hypothetical protein
MDPLLTFYHFHHVCVSNMKFEFYVEIKLQAPTVFQDLLLHELCYTGEAKRAKSN